MNEVGKLIPAEKELCVPVPSKVRAQYQKKRKSTKLNILQDTIRHKYAKELMDLHWRKIKVYNYHCRIIIIIIPMYDCFGEKFRVIF